MIERKAAFLGNVGNPADPRIEHIFERIRSKNSGPNSVSRDEKYRVATFAPRIRFIL